MRYLERFLADKLKENVITFLFYSIIILFFYRGLTYFHSMDGPAHFYNSFLLKEYLGGNETVKQHFVLNAFYVPNLFSNYFISFLLFFLSFKTAAAVFFILYYFLSFYSARYLFKAYEVSYAGFCSLVILVFFNSLLLNLGFYNFSWSIIFLMFSFGFYRKFLNEKDKVLPRNYLLYFLLCFLMYYSNALTLMFFLVYIFIIEGIRAVNLVFHKQKTPYNVLLPHLIKLFCGTLPFLLMMLLFYLNAPLEKSATPNDYNSLTKLLVNVSSLIVYSYPEESVFTQYIFYFISAAMMYTIIRRLILRLGFVKPDIFLMLGVFLLILYYLIPDGSSVGMMSPRLQHFFYLFIIVWLIMQKDRFMPVILTVMLVSLSVYKFHKVHYPILRSFDSQAMQIAAVEKYIEPDKSVMSLNYSENWLLPHGSNYLGLNKPMIILDNYETILAWFPLSWNYKNMPIYQFANERVSFVIDESQTIKNERRKADYVFVFGNLNKLAEKQEYTEELKNNYQLVYTDSKYLELFRLK